MFKKNSITQGDSLELLKKIPDKSIDLVFADPPYNLQLRDTLYRPDQTTVEAVTNDWDKFDTYQAYDEFCLVWLKECKRVLKDGGALWVIGSYHNILRLGTSIQNLGFWILNDIIWHKTNPMPNFRGTRFTAAYVFQEQCKWKSANKHMLKISDTLLMGHILAQRYLHPKCYTSKYLELYYWLKKYNDHPQAKRIYRLAIKRFLQIL